jgi:hypothetical protein
MYIEKPINQSIFLMH